jgi:hypothetical protein
MAIGISRFISLFQSWFLKSWGEGYDPIPKFYRTISFTQTFWTTGFSLTQPFKDFPPPTENVRPWILAFFLINLSLNFTLMLFRVWEVLILYFASKQLFIDVMVKVTGASFRYYDVTPIGRLMNRLTSDMVFGRLMLSSIGYVFG